MLRCYTVTTTRTRETMFVADKARGDDIEAIAKKMASANRSEKDAQEELHVSLSKGLAREWGASDRVYLSLGDTWGFHDDLTADTALKLNDAAEQRCGTCRHWNREHTLERVSCDGTKEVIAECMYQIVFPKCCAPSAPSFVMSGSDGADCSCWENRNKSNFMLREC